MFHEFQKGNGDMHYELYPGKAFELHEIRLHLAAAGGANNFTVTLQSSEGPEYDVVLNTQDMSAVTDEVYQPTRPQAFRDGDTLLFEWTNGSSVAWGLEVVWA